MSIKTYTDLEQSKMLAEILPYTTSDMFYTPIDNYNIPWVKSQDLLKQVDEIPCWTLAALKDALPIKITKDSECFKEYYLTTRTFVSLKGLKTHELSFKCSKYKGLHLLENNTFVQITSYDLVEAYVRMFTELKEHNLLFI